MARKILNRKQENWLYEHHSAYPNAVLAEKLTAMIKEEFAAQVKKLTAALPSIVHPATRRMVEKDLNFYSSFEGVDEAFVRANAKRLKCPRKSSAYISDLNRKKASITKQKIWTNKAAEISSTMPWLRSFRAREVRYCKLKSETDIKTMRAAISNWNRLEGEDEGIQLTSQVDREILVMRVEAKVYRAFS